MKKQVALLLATVMAVSALSVNAFAATNNYVDNRLTVPDKTAVMESGLGYSTFNTYLYKGNLGGDPDYYVDGTDLVVPLQRDVTGTYSFKLTLANAKWYFRNNYLDYQSQKDFPARVGDATSPGALSTYDTTKGTFAVNSSNNDAGTYTRASLGATTLISGATYAEIPYELVVSSLDNKVATVTINKKAIDDALALTGRSEAIMRIPLVTYISDSNVEATVTIDPGNVSTVTSQKLIFANTSDGKTNSTAKSVINSRDIWDLDTFVVSELRVGTIRDNEIITLTLPNGFHFTQNWGNNTDNNVSVGIDSGLGWGDGSTGYGNYVQASLTSNYAISAPITGSGNERNYTLFYGNGNSYYYNDKLQNYTSTGGYYNEDDSVLNIYVGDITSSSQLRGAIYIDNLQIWADDTVSVPASGSSFDIIMNVKDQGNITGQDVLVAKRVEWALTLTTVTDVPTLVSGRYIDASWSGVGADDNTHKTARVKLTESAANAWWGSRTTVLSLPATDNNTIKGAKFRKLTVDGSDNVNTALKDTNTSSLMYGTSSTNQWLNDGEKHGVITLNDNKITISNISLDTSKTSNIRFNLWVSIEYGFGAQTGDLKLSVDPSSTSLTTTDAANLPSVVIAHVVDPVTVSTTVTDLKIGYQYQTTADIQIKENGAGYLLKDKTVRVSITDLISSDMYFTNDTKIAVTSGDLKLKNLIVAGQGGFTSQSRSWLTGSGTGVNDGTGSIAFDIDRESTVASTITISNIAVKLDRTVPVTNKSAYQVVVWGTAIAENYGLVDNQGRTWKAGFDTPGDFKDYINVISSPEDQPSILSQEVRVTIGESYYVVNGKTYSMDAVAYISPASNSTMVPVRFVANAFGLRDDQILWDDTNKTATINAPNKVVQFTLNSSTMIVNGVSITMQSPDGLPVVAEIKTINGLGRMYLPFRALGNAFGVPVDWEADTQTAIYNLGANTDGTAAVSNTTPVSN